MTEKVELHLTQSELKTRKHWFLYILIVFGFNLLATGFMLVNAIGRENLLHEAFEILFKFLWGTFWCYLSYYFCYKKQTTFLLTLTLVSHALVAIACIFVLWVTSFASPNLHLFVTSIILSGLISIPFMIVLILTYKLRRINKMIRCQRMYPTESDELIQDFRSASDMNSLGSTFKSAMEKTIVDPKNWTG